MTEAETTRKTPVLKIRSKSRSADEFVARYCMDFSRAGMFIKTKRPFEAGTTLRFEFQLLDETAVFAGKGTVAWRREDKDDLVRPAGMGVSFDELQESAAALVERLVRSRGGRRSRFDDRGSTPPVVAGPLAPEATGILASIAERPLDIGSSPPSPLAARLKSSPPGALAVPAPSGPPVAPDPWRAAEPDEEPLIEDPEEALGARLVEEADASRERASVEAMGQLHGVLSKAFEETVRRTSRPPRPDDLNLARIDPDAAAPTASLATQPHGDFDSNWPEPEPASAPAPAYQPRFEHGPYTGRETALSDPHRQQRLHSLFDKAKFDEPPKHFRGLTWWLMALLGLFVVAAALLRFAGPEAIADFVGRLVDSIPNVLPNFMRGGD